MRMNRIYLDHAAATPADPRVVSEMAAYWNDAYANPGSIHKEGVFAGSKIHDARTSVANILGVHSDEIVFTGSATESANLALFGTVRAWQQNHPGRTAHVVVSVIEHDAVLGPVRMLEDAGVRVTKIPVDEEGIVLVKNISEAITEDTVIISIMYANNEIGTIQPIREIAKVIRKWKKEFRGAVRTEKPMGDERYPLFHTDACQATNYLDMNISRLGVDLLTLSAAKIYGPKGVGLLAITREVPLTPLIVGGGQERGRRAGTENVSGIIGLSTALLLAEEMKESECNRLIEIRDYCISQLREFPDIVINGSIKECLPNIVNFSFSGVDHEFLAIALDAKGIAVSTKSACDEGESDYSHVLVALNEARGRDHPMSGIRLSFGRQTTKEHIERFIVVLQEVRKQLIFPIDI